MNDIAINEKTFFNKRKSDIWNDTDKQRKYTNSLYVKVIKKN